MRLVISLFLAVFCLFPSLLHAAWYEVETENFIVRGDASKATLEDFAQELEQYRVFLGVITGGQVPPPEPVRVPVYVMASSRSFDKIYDNPLAAGVFTSRIDAPIFVGNAERRSGESFVRGGKRDTGREARQTILHEYVHYFTYMNGPAYYPIWFSEGAADYYSTFTYNNGTASVGALHSMRGSWLVHGSMKPWDEVFNSIRNWQGGISSKDVSMFYAQSWLAVHFMFNHPERVQPLGVYLEKIARGRADPEQVFKDSFGVSTAEMGRLVKAYLKTNRLPVQRYDLSRYEISPIVSTRKLEGWEEEYALAFARRFFARNVASLAEVTALHEKVLAVQPDYVPSLLEMAHIRLEQQDRAATEALVARIEAVAPDDPQLWILQGLLLPVGSWEARELFDRARKKDPRQVLAHYNYAKSFPEGGATEEALDAALEAMARSADRTEVPLLAGRMLVELGYKDDARYLLEPITVWSNNIAIRQRASRLLAQL